jgi:hypothetical protein
MSHQQLADMCAVFGRNLSDLSHPQSRGHHTLLHIRMIKHEKMHRPTGGGLVLLGLECV